MKQQHTALYKYPEFCTLKITVVSSSQRNPDSASLLIFATLWYNSHSIPHSWS